MTTCLPPMHTIAQPPSTPFPSLSGMCLSKGSLAASYASYVVRVHTRHGIKTLSFDVLAAFFTLTAKKAAEDLGISSRTLIRVCRSLGIRRWPYLGFRSEKNVDRIRQEAMENLRRKLQKEGESSPTAVLHPNAPSLRGASAKRLLQVKLPQLALPSLHSSATASHKVSPLGIRPCCPSPQPITATTVITDDDEPMPSADESECRAAAPTQLQHAPTFLSPHAVSAPLQTPPTTTHSFNLDLQHISPRKEVATASSTVQLPQPSSLWTAPKICTSSPSKPAASAMPSLNLLVDASILTSFKHDMDSHMTATYSESAHHSQQSSNNSRTMSMQDILALQR